MRWPSGRTGRAADGVSDIEPPLRAALFSGAQLEAHARSLASDGILADRSGREMLLRRLAENETIIRRSYEEVAKSVRQGHPQTPAAKWLVENFFFIEEQIDQVRLLFPPGYSRQLPVLGSGALRHYPRVYDLVIELVAHTDGRVDAENIAQFIRAYQTIHPLKLGELWAVPIMASLALVENLRRVSRRIAWRRRQWGAAVVWSRRFIEAIQDDPKSLITILAEFVQSEPVKSSPFLAELTACLQGTHPAMELVINWVEQELSERGQTLEMLQQAESQDQAADHASISHSIASLRQLGRIDWRDTVESLSVVETILLQDPGGTHRREDFRSRDRCRREIEDLSRRSGREERDVAATALRLATEQAQRREADPREGTVGYYLVGDGRFRIEAELRYRPSLRRRLERRARRAALPIYVLTVATLTGALSLLVMSVAGTGRPVWWLAAALAATLLAASRSAVSLVNWWASLWLSPRVLPRLDFSEGIPDEHRTAVVVPAMLTSAAAVDRLLEHLELRYLGNRDPNLPMVLLTDLPDADQEALPADAALIERAAGRIREMNVQYAAAGQTAFHLLHRPRRWNPRQRCWMGRERKRGKIEDFNRLVLRGATEPFAQIEGDPSALRDVRYGIVLDADTQLPPRAAWRMIASLAHPLNRPHVDPARRCVTHGYGILQPRLGVSLPQSQSSRFAALFAGEVGLDPYSREVSNVYQDLFGQGQFVGKGIYDIRAFDVAVSARFPDNRILSHDLIEGGHARCGFLGDVELLEDHPTRYLADVARRRRWARGDWQIARWLLPRVPGPDGARQSNPLGSLARWMILDNLRRTLVPGALLTALLLGWFGLPQSAPAWTALLAGVFLLPDILRSLRALAFKPRPLTYAVYLPHIAARECRAWMISLLEWLAIPFLAFVQGSDILRTQWRLFKRGRLLEWQTASDSGFQARITWTGTFLAMWPAPVAAGIVGLCWAGVQHAGFAVYSPETFLAMGPTLAGWFVSPAILWWLGRPASRRAGELDEGQRRLLRRTARRTWEYFARFAGPENHWLPPDNVQHDPPIGEATRTSPTNMGMALLSNLAAWDFGYLSAGSLLDRTERAFRTMEQLPRHRGHFLNWYDTRTLQPSEPRYVSTADSGNLAGSLIALKTGLTELADRPILPPRWREGMQDVVGVLVEELDRPQLTGHPAARRARKAMAAWLDSLASCANTRQGASHTLAALAATASQLEPAMEPESEVAYWLGAVRRQCEDLLADLERFSEPTVAPPGPARAAPETEVCGYVGLRVCESLPPHTHTLTPPHTCGGAVPVLRDLACPDSVTAIGRPGPIRERAGQWLTRLADLAQRCEALSHMELAFLYDPTHKLLSIGYNLEERERDPGVYDLLASEARLCSYLGIARGQLPTEHWFHLGRQLAPGGRAAALISWSGSMFEYLMPLLLLPNFEATLLDQSCREAVARQIRHGRRHRMPWGVSESGYHQLDAQKAYQYRAFGVPGLGLKQGLRDDLVVAPYATVLAAMVDPRAACANLEAMAVRGFRGRYGFFEAVDFTPGRVPPDRTFALVSSHMAHHSGMSLLALDQALLDQPMHGRFLGDPRMRASLLLLQERIPLAQVRTRTDLTRAYPHPQRGDESADPTTRIFRTADSAVPEVHLLSNGRYHVMISAAGSGYSRWRDLSLTRWQEDSTRDHWGAFLYLRDRDADTFWSATSQPTGRRFDRFEAQFSQGVAEFRATRDGIRTHLRVAVSPEDDVELRRLAITNQSSRERQLEVASYAEVALLNGPGASEQPAFNGLFLEAEAMPARAAILCARRTRSPDEHWPVFFHGLMAHDRPLADGVTCETDRERFLGRGRGAANPAAMDGEPPDNPGSPTLDPVMSVRRVVRLAPGESVTLDAVWGVAPDRDAAFALLDRYDDPHLATRVFELARMHSQILLHELQATEANAQLFGRMACSLLYLNPRLRARADLVAGNRKGQSALWAYGISGDLPIVLLRISDPASMDLARLMIQAHAYWRHKGLAVDLVILSDAYDGYRNNPMDALIGLINVGTGAKTLDQSAGIFVRNVAQVPDEDALLFQAVSRIVLSDRAGTLAEQLDRAIPTKEETIPFKPTRKPEEPPRKSTPPPRRDLLFRNGLGGFTPDGREYIITLEPGAVTPAPWVNVLANPQFGTVVSESGAAYTWYRNAHEFRLTPWTNDAVSDIGGECFYLRDEESGAFWSPTPGPARGRGSYVIRHGLGYTAFEHAEQGIATESYVYVAPEEPLKFMAVSIRNTSDRPRRLSLTGYVEWVLGESRQRNAMHVATRLDSRTGALFASNAYGQDMAGAVAFFHCSSPDRTVTGRRTEFLGRNGSPAAPAAMRRKALSNKVSGGDPCAAIQAPMEIPAGEQRHIVFVLGAADDEHRARALLLQHGGIDAARHMLETVWDFWKRQLGGVHVETPDPSVNLLVNYWLPYQMLACRIWGRSGFYQSGGAFGFRDQLQDSLALLYESPALTREHLLRCAGRQFPEGDVQHWWHPPSGRGVRTRIADDYLWLPYAVCRYVAVTGDTGVLEETTPFLDAPSLDAGEADHYGLPRVTERHATLWEHCVCALNRAMRHGARGLPLMEGGDWNDGMNRVGREGKGESVWLAFFLHDVLSAFANLARKRGDAAYAEACLTEARRLSASIEANAWDGEWYARAFFDDGRPLGSSRNTQCRIDLLPQSWAVLSGATDPERSRQALDSALKRLVDPDAAAIRLFAPPFDGDELDPGYIRGYIPGVRENGGQYTHAALWAVMAVARLGRTEEAWRLFSMLNPICHADSPEKAARYKVEPYVVAADVYSARGHEGRGGWTWYTGSAAWMYRLLVEELLGLRLEVDTLTFAPLLPAEWPEFTLHYRYRNTLYHIRVVKTGEASAHVQRVTLEGIEQADKSIHLVDDGREHPADVEMGALPTEAAASSLTP
jgi:cyclic beta-1,2-glucan synthetase